MDQNVRSTTGHKRITVAISSTETCFGVIKEVTKLLSSFFAGEENLRPEEEEPGAGEVQVCPGLQDQRTEETDRAQRERHQGDEGADSRGQRQLDLFLDGLSDPSLSPLYLSWKSMAHAMAR